jgi:curli biogenesis system outer membrane secretion channel CsgG
MLPILAAAASGDTPPTVAVLDFDTSALTTNSYGTFEPGIAVPDLLAERLVNGGRFDVLDRAYLDQALERHHARARGIVDPDAAMATGRLLGARYLVSGTISELGRDGGDAASNDRLTLAVTIRVVDATTGRVVQSFSDEKTEKAAAIADPAFAGYTAGDYGSARFTYSSVGRLIDDEAGAVAANLDPVRLAAATAGRPLLDGRALEVDGKTVIVDVGAARGATVGAVFDVVKAGSGETTGKLEILSVAAGTSVGRLLSGAAAKGDAVRSE